MSIGADELAAAEFRRVIGHWATGVSVVTAAGPSGCTVNAITSVSLNPLLLIVCFDVTSNTLAIVRRTGRFCINVLGAGQHAIAARFASKDEMAAKFAHVECSVINELPEIGGAIASIHCDVVDQMPAGDHVVFLARPMRLSTIEHPEPLVFYRSAYHRVVDHVQTADAAQSPTPGTQRSEARSHR
jgi:3-hydroxy-9,10-secoandrosta-1,3,5(10)-triene-9,17-dione monooxygenase reductase component